MKIPYGLNSTINQSKQYEDNYEKIFKGTQDKRKSRIINPHEAKNNKNPVKCQKPSEKVK